MAKKKKKPKPKKARRSIASVDDLRSYRVLGEVTVDLMTIVRASSEAEARALAFTPPLFSYGLHELKGDVRITAVRKLQSPGLPMPRAVLPLKREAPTRSLMKRVKDGR